MTASIATFAPRAMPALAVALVVAMAGHAPTAAAADGRTLFLDAKKGNCASCHQAPRDAGVKSLSTIGPVLQDMQLRYGDLRLLAEAIADMGKRVPGTAMPPYARHRILTDPEIAAIARYVSTL